MKVFAISDLHLSLAEGNDKPMDVFGDQWVDHAARIDANWRAAVGDDDWVLMGGDLSWARNLDEVGPDLAFVDALPGQKLMVKGNHAHWWGSRAKVEAVLPASIRVLQNDAFVLPDRTCVVGTRGWVFPGRSEVAGQEYDPADQKVYERELGRLELSIAASRRLEHERIWALIHYPPRYTSGLETGFVELMKEAGVELCVYGHLHGADCASGFVGVEDGIRYVMASVDAIDFAPVLLRES